MKKITLSEFSFLPIIQDFQYKGLILLLDYKNSFINLIYQLININTQPIRIRHPLLSLFSFPSHFYKLIEIITAFENRIQTMLKLSEQEIVNFKKAFDIFDKDGNGSISKEEMQTVFEQLSIKLPQSQIDRIISLFDENGDDAVEFEEFIYFLSSNLNQDDTETWIFDVFSILDQDCDGLVSKDELMAVVKLYSLEIQQKEIDLILEVGDVHEEGGLNYQEFCKIVKGK